MRTEAEIREYYELDPVRRWEFEYAKTGDFFNGDFDKLLEWILDIKP